MKRNLFAVLVLPFILVLFPHWLMRGVIEVTATDGRTVIPAVPKPMFERLGIDIDAMRHAPVSLPAAPPSATRGATLAASRNAEPTDMAGELYARYCAACHGEAGRGDGVAGKNLPGMSKMDPSMRAGPADFTDAGQMLAAPDALLQGKLLRGGMGTGMPEFGSLYTDEELWAMVSYLRTFLFTK